MSAALRALCALLVLVALGCTADEAATPSVAPTTMAGFAPGWTALPPSPLAAEAAPATVPVAGAIVVLGRPVPTFVGPQQAAAMYDAGSGAWRLLPRPPVDAFEVLATGAADDVAVFVGRACAPGEATLACWARPPAAMVYDAGSDRWRARPVPPAVGTATAVVPLGSDEDTAWFAFIGPSWATYSGFDRSTGRWTAPHRRSRSALHVCGSGHLAVELSYRAKLPNGSVVESDPLRLRDLTGVTYVEPRITTFRLDRNEPAPTVAAAPGFESTQEPRVRCAGARAAVIGGQEIAVFDIRRRRWRGEVPVPAQASGARVVAGDDAVLLLHGTDATRITLAGREATPVRLPFAVDQVVRAGDGFVVHAGAAPGVAAGRLFVFNPGGSRLRF